MILYYFVETYLIQYNLISISNTIVYDLQNDTAHYEMV